MPLDRAHLTVASQITVPTYAIFFTIVGSNFIVGPYDRLAASPMLRYADSIMSIRIWGALFLGCGLLMFAAMWTHQRDLYRFGLLICALSMIVWAAIALLGVLVEPVSYSAWAWPGAMAAFCLASNRSLVRDRRTTDGA